jgi:hypothetical protein
MEFDEFKLEGTNAFIKVDSAPNEVQPTGRSCNVWARVQGVPDANSLRA